MPKLRITAACALLAGCAGQGDDPAAGADPFGIANAPPGLVRGTGGGGGTPVSPGPNLETQLAGNAGAVLNEDEIVFTDPDAEDPDDIAEELKELLKAAPTEGPWRKSYDLTFREARRLNRPVLIWFTDSRNSPPCKALSQELFNRKEFEEWASETFVRLQVDQNIETNRSDDLHARQTGFVKELKRRFKVRGQPTLLVLTPGDATVVGRYTGFKRGESEYKWGQLRQGASLTLEAQEDWKKRMEKQGYRTWKDPIGRSVFAKLAAYRDGEIILVEPHGNRVRTKEKHLSPADQDWIAAQKRARGMQ